MHPDSDQPDCPSASADLRRRIERFLDDVRLVERVYHVMSTMPNEIVEPLLDDPCFHISRDNFVPGQGGSVWMACPNPLEWKGSRSVVLKSKLATCPPGFAHYIIAHELAHAHLWNGGTDTIPDPEEAADFLAEEWGFPKP